MTDHPTWAAEMLRLHRRASWRIGWWDAAACCAVIAFLAWGLT
jgi:hypothetical protein